MADYQVNYSDDALCDLRDIFEYIAFELKEADTVTAQINRIRRCLKR